MATPQNKIKIPSKTNPVQGAPVQAPEAAPESGPHAAPAPQKPEMTKEQKKALFDNAFAFDDAVEKLNEQIESIKKEKSVAVKAVLDACGKGPFQFRGREITISSREGTYFFKDYGKRELESVD